MDDLRAPLGGDRRPVEGEPQEIHRLRRLVAGQEEERAARPGHRPHVRDRREQVAVEGGSRARAGLFARVGHPGHGARVRRRGGSPAGEHDDQARGQDPGGGPRREPGPATGGSLRGIEVAPRRSAGGRDARGRSWLDRRRHRGRRDCGARGLRRAERLAERGLGGRIERGEHLAGRRPARLSVEPEGPIDHARKGPGHLGRHALERPRRATAGVDQQGLGAVPLVDELACEEGEHGGAHGPEVGPCVDRALIAERLLGGHERRRPHRAAGARGGGEAERAVQAGDPEVEDLQRPLARQEQVLRLDVAVDDPLVVRGDEHAEKLASELRDDQGRQPAPLRARQALQVLALEQLHDQEGGAIVGRVLVEHAHRAGVVDLVGDDPFAQEPGVDVGVERHVRVQHLDGHAAPDADVPPRVHGGRAPDPDEALEEVLAAEDPADAAFGERVHVEHRPAIPCLRSNR